MSVTVMCKDTPCNIFSPKGLIVGGIQEDRTYSSRVEAFAPGRRCHGMQGAPLPVATTGAVAALVNGHPVVCGGARQGPYSIENHA